MDTFEQRFEVDVQCVVLEYINWIESSISTGQESSERAYIPSFHKSSSQLRFQPDSFGEGGLSLCASSIVVYVLP